MSIQINHTTNAIIKLSPSYNQSVCQLHKDFGVDLNEPGISLKTNLLRLREAMRYLPLAQDNPKYFELRQAILLLR